MKRFLYLPIMLLLLSFLCFGCAPASEPAGSSAPTEQATTPTVSVDFAPATYPVEISEKTFPEPLLRQQATMADKNGDGAFRKKSEAKMKSIIQGGATTILVSHSIAQVRSMCNKILWLDRGKQITFGDDVKRICDAYEEYLKTKILPTEI